MHPERYHPFPRQLCGSNCLRIASGTALKTKLQPLSLSPVQPSYHCPSNLPTLFVLNTDLFRCTPDTMSSLHLLYFFWKNFLDLSPRDGPVGIIKSNNSSPSGWNSDQCDLADFTSQLRRLNCCHNLYFVVHVRDFLTAIQHVHKLTNINLFVMYWFLLLSLPAPWLHVKLASSYKSPG